MSGVVPSRSSSGASMSRKGLHRSSVKICCTAAVSPFDADRLSDRLTRRRRHSCSLISSSVSSGIKSSTRRLLLSIAADVAKNKVAVDTVVMGVETVLRDVVAEKHEEQVDDHE